MAKKKLPPPATCCLPVDLPAEFWERAAEMAVRENPANAPPPCVMLAQNPSYLAVVTGKYWGAAGVDLSVGFMEPTPTDLRDRILSHLNAWGEFCHVVFRWTAISPEIRITRSGDGYWSYVGTDNLAIPRTAATMCLAQFTMKTSEEEYRRVVRHEAGHALGFAHEHQRAEVIDRIDADKAIAYYKERIGWSEQMIRSQVLTPVSERALMGTPRADPESIMAYHIPAALMRDKIAVPGGKDFSALDRMFAAKMYPKPGTPPAPIVSQIRLEIELVPSERTGKVRWLN